MGMVEIIVDFVKHGGNSRATHLCLIIVKLHFARSRINFSTPNTLYAKHIPTTKTEAGQQHLAQFNNKKTTKIAQFEHRRIHRTSALLCSQDKSLKKKTWPFTPAPKRSPTVPTPVLPRLPRLIRVEASNTAGRVHQLQAFFLFLRGRHYTFVYLAA
jgi:hypothetical protein